MTFFDFLNTLMWITGSAALVIGGVVAYLRLTKKKLVVSDDEQRQTTHNENWANYRSFNQEYQAVSVATSVTAAVSPGLRKLHQDLRQLGISPIRAGDILSGVPTLGEDQAERIEATRTVVTCTRVVAQAMQGPVPANLVEMENGYLLLVCAGKVAILKARGDDDKEDALIARERREIVETDDSEMQFAGKQWHISGAYGDREDIATGKLVLSTIEVVSAHPTLGEEGSVLSLLPTHFTDGGEKRYYDLRARTDEGDVLYALYVGEEEYHIFTGRILEPVEIRDVQVISG